MQTHAMHILAVMGSGEWIALVSLVATVLLSVIGAAFAWVIKATRAEATAKARAEVIETKFTAEIAGLRTEIKTMSDRFCEYFEHMDARDDDHEKRIRDLERRRSHAPSMNGGAD